MSGAHRGTDLFQKPDSGVTDCNYYGRACILAKAEGCSLALVQELLTPPQWMSMEGQFGPKHLHPALDLLVKTYPQHITDTDSLHSRPGAREHQHPKYP